MTPATAYDDCIEAALSAAEQQTQHAKTARDDSTRAMHHLSASTLASFAGRLAKMKDVRRQAGDL